MSQKNQENSLVEKKLKISIVVPAYNEEKRIARCIASLRELDFPKDEYEIIIVDNNSTDNTLQIAQTFKEVRVIQEKEKQGVGAAREAGWRVARGEIIASTDADCEPRKNWLKKIWNAFEKDKELVGMSAGYLFYDHTFFVNWLVILIEVFMVITTWTLSKGIFGFTGNNMAVRREIYLKTEGFDTDRCYGEDMDMAAKVQQYGKIHWFFAPGYRVRTSARRYRLGKDTLHLVPYILNFVSSSARNKAWRNDLHNAR